MLSIKLGVFTLFIIILAFFTRFKRFGENRRKKKIEEDPNSPYKLDLVYKVFVIDL